MVTCEVCNGGVKEISVNLVSKFYKFGKCLKCGLFQNLDPQPASQLEGENFKRYVLAQDESFEAKRRANVLSQLEHILFLNDLKLNVFDIGTGSGVFLFDAMQRGFVASGSELSKSAVVKVKERYGIEIFLQNYEEIGFSESHSSVTMFCVLAHSVNPLALLNAIYESLQEGGVLYFHTPRYCLIDSIAIYLSNFSNGKFNKLLLRRIGGDHRRIYSREALEHLLQKCQFMEYRITSEIGYGLTKESYFTAMGIPVRPSKFIGFLLNLLSRFNLLPRNIFTVYAIKKHGEIGSGIS